VIIRWPCAPRDDRRLLVWGWQIAQAPWRSRLYRAVLLAQEIGVRFVFADKRYFACGNASSRRLWSFNKRAFLEDTNLSGSHRFVYQNHRVVHLKCHLMSKWTNTLNHCVSTGNSKRFLCL